MWGIVRTSVAALALALIAGALATHGAPPVSQAAARATVVITADGGKARFTPATVTAPGGTVTVVNLDSIDHTVTSNAVDAEGRPLFDVRIPAGETTTITQTEALANGTYAYFCKFHPGMRGTLVVTGSEGEVEPQRPAFEQPLVVPRVVRGRDIRLPMTPARVRVLPDGPRTPMWTYAGSWPGPTIRRPAGGDTRVTFAHRLPRRAGSMSVHLHGSHHAPKDDGQPTTHLLRPGTERTYRYPLMFGDDPVAGSFFWYHDHRMDKTARNNWRGLQGMFVVDDPADAELRLPTGARDIPLMISDRSFRRDNRLTDPFARGPRMTHHHGQMAWLGRGAPPDDHSTGTHVLVNGRYAPYHRVSATRHRLRLLNSSPFTAYNFELSDGRPFVQIGTGNGLLKKPVVRDTIVLGPAQRADVIVDFHGESGNNVVLSSVPRDDEGAAVGTGTREAALMEFRVGRRAPDPSRLPSTLPSPRLVRAPARVSKTWRFDLGGNDRHGTFWSINGRSFDPGRAAHRPRLGSVERWRLRNTSDMTHYVHIHAEQWRTVLRNGRRPPPWERALEDTWRLDPGDVVEVAARFKDYTGPFMIHCHMLDHEDHGMMARFDVVRR
ncbi:multicopper oxidase domain-containing protein [Nocardioides piscis]|uniref:Multicopper oxidase domain-containing protein n=1 Tax=Nocardioides piscis TaxID=2714938 RepID=A0A6G7YH64_9ACTN|nr:multicopper oxidase domain-containing protein [Nocardioides piscis]QIK75957.1 multicopper oxidase domain-containing protein [Nocardioides piscis]